MVGTKRGEYNLPILVALLIRVVLCLPLYYHPETSLEPDSMAYIETARNFRGAADSRSELPIGGGPFYAVFLATLGPFALPVQVLISIFWLGPFGRHLEKTVSPRAARITIWLLAIDPLSAILSTMVLSDFFCMAWVAAAIILLRRDERLAAACFSAAALTRFSAILLPIWTGATRRRLAVVLISALPLVVYLFPAAGSTSPLSVRVGSYLLWNAAMIECDGDSSRGGTLYSEWVNEISPENRFGRGIEKFSSSPARSASFYARRIPALLLGSSSQSLMSRFNMAEGSNSATALRLYSACHALIVWTCVGFSLTAARRTAITENAVRVCLILIPAVRPDAYGRFRLPAYADIFTMAAHGVEEWTRKFCTAKAQ